MTVAFSNATHLTHYPSFDSWWQTQGEWVEEPNERRGGYSGVQRLTQLGQSLYAKKQTGHTYRSLLHPWGRPTVLRERDRVEIYRPLIADPKEVRKQRAAKAAKAKVDDEGV